MVRAIPVRRVKSHSGLCRDRQTQKDMASSGEAVREANRVDPDFNPSDADIEIAARLLARAAATQPIHYVENGNGKFQKWMMGLMAVLAAMAVGGVIVMYGQLAALQADMANVKAQITEVKKLVEPRFRGG
jgi:hypothetical protein